MIESNASHIAALKDLRLGVEMDRHHLDDGDAKLAALDAALAVLSKLRAPVITDAAIWVQALPRHDDWVTAKCQQDRVNGYDIPLVTLDQLNTPVVGKLESISLYQALDEFGRNVDPYAYGLPPLWGDATKQNVFKIIRRVLDRHHGNQQ